MNKILHSKLLGFLLFLFLLLIVFFATTILAYHARNLNLVPNEGEIQVTEENKTSEYVTPKHNALYVYYMYNEDETANDAKFYKNEIVIRQKDDLLHRKTVLADFSEYDELYSIKDGTASLLGRTTINTREDLIYNYENIPDNNIFDENTSNVLLKEPIEINNSWSYADRSVSEITDINVYVELPFGNFNAVEVTTNFEDGRFRKNYYVKFLGLVKTVISTADSGYRTIILHDIKDEGILSKAYLFSYDVYSNTTDVDLIDNTINTNPIYIETLETMLKFEKSAVNTPLIQDNTYIQSVTIDRNENVAYIDFSSSFLKKSTSGIQIESEVLKAIANTVGNFYSTKYVKITADGSDRIGGHADFSENYTVDLQK